MATLKYVGKRIQDDGSNPNRASDLVHKSYLDTLTAGNMIQGDVDTRITSNMSGYATNTYVSSAVSSLATPTYLATQAGNYILNSQVGIANGPIRLGPGGRISPGQISAASTQRWPTPFWTPASYNAAPITATTTPVTIYTASVPNPGFTYKLLVHGTVDAKVSLDNGEYPQIIIRQGSTTGQIVASGNGLGQHYAVGIPQSYTTAGAYAYTIPTAATVIDGILLGGGGGGQNGYLVPYWFSYINVNGAAGAPGAFKTFTWTRGTDIPWTTTQITGTVGAGGATAAAGSATTATATGVPTQTAAGGAASAGASWAAAAVGSVSYQGGTYTGGAAGTALGAAGNAPGGGGNGSSSGATAGAGAAGAVWFSARFGTTNDPDNYGTVTVVPTYATQTPINGATTLYVMMKSSGSSATVTASPSLPSLWFTPVPA